MLYVIAKYFIIFLFYSVIGYVYEVIAMSVINKKFSLSRGYLIGPYLPVYGFGVLIITLFLTKYSKDYLTLFILGMTYSSILEYLTSYLLEKIYGLRWWDYSEKKYNINGRINLVTAIKFGISAIIIVEFLNPIIFKILKYIPKNILIILFIILFIIMISDAIFSSYIIAKLNIDIDKYSKKDATEEIKARVIESIRRHRRLHRRFLSAYPYLSRNNNEYKSIRELLKRKK